MSANNTDLELYEAFLAPENNCHFTSVSALSQASSRSRGILILYINSPHLGLGPFPSIASWILLFSLHELGTQIVGNDLTRSTWALSCAGSVSPLQHVLGLLSSIQFPNLRCHPAVAIAATSNVTFYMGSSHMCHQIFQRSFYFPYGQPVWCIFTLKSLPNPWEKRRENSEPLFFRGTYKNYELGKTETQLNVWVKAPAKVIGRARTGIKILLTSFPDFPKLPAKVDWIQQTLLHEIFCFVGAHEASDQQFLWLCVPQPKSLWEESPSYDSGTINLSLDQWPNLIF